MSNEITKEQVESAIALIRNEYEQNDETCGFNFEIDYDNNFYLKNDGYQIEEDISDFIYDDEKMFEWTKMIMEMGIEWNEELQ